MKDDIFLIDTNILVYSYDASEPDKQNICASLIKKCWSKEDSYAISLQNLSEFYVAATKKIEYPLSGDAAKKIIKDILDFTNWHVISFDDKTIISAIDISLKYGIHYWDALLCATMKKHGITNVFTENTGDFKKVPWITSIDPLK